MTELPKVLFVCTFKGGRSQIAEAYSKKKASKIFEVRSACFDPGTIKKDFVEFVETLGLEIDTNSPPSVFDIAHEREIFDYVVCICSNVGTEMCAFFRANIEKIFLPKTKLLHWDLPDFRECQGAEEGFSKCVQGICKRIEKHVDELAATIQNLAHS